MCQEHTAKRKCWPGANHHGLNHRVCVDDEKRVLRRTRGCCWGGVFTFFLMIALNLGIRAAVGQFD